LSPTSARICTFTDITSISHSGCFSDDPTTTQSCSKMALSVLGGFVVLKNKNNFSLTTDTNVLCHFRAVYSIQSLK